jgi:hypothetical protein
MHMQLGDVLARHASRRGKPQSQRVVDDLAAVRLAHAHKHSFARLRQLANQGFERGPRLRTRYPQHRDRRRRPARGESKDGIAIFFHRPHRQSKQSAINRASWSRIAPLPSM